MTHSPDQAAGDYTFSRESQLHNLKDYSLVEAAFLAGYKLAHEWIPVSERLPEINEEFGESNDVLCLANTCQFVGWYNGKQERWFVSHFLAESAPLSFENIPTHWQPLPTPPKPEP